MTLLPLGKIAARFVPGVSGKALPVFSQKLAQSGKGSATQVPSGN
jgi:hypothetical protein